MDRKIDKDRGIKRLIPLNLIKGDRNEIYHFNCIFSINFLWNMVF